MTKASKLFIIYVATIVVTVISGFFFFGAAVVEGTAMMNSQSYPDYSETETESEEAPMEDESTEEIPEEESDEDLVTEDATTEEEAPVEDESTSTEEEAPVEDETDATETEEEETVTSDDVENMDALAEAQEFLDYGPLSRKALYETLCGDYGMGYSESAAEYAVDNVEANWNEMALDSAHILLEGVPDMSDDEIYATLVGEGMGFTDAEAQYAIDNLGSN